MPSSWFRITYAANAFRRSLSARGAVLDELRLASAAEACRVFYRDARAQHTRLDEGEDTLRVTWSADVDGVSVVISRRMQRTGNYVPLESLDLTLRYALDDALSALEPGDLVVTHPEHLSVWITELRATPVYAALVRRRPVSISLDEISGPR